MSAIIRYPVVGSACPALDQASAWFAEVSHGRFVPVPVRVAVPALAGGWAAFAADGGRDRRSRCSQDLVAALVSALGAPERCAVAAAGGRLVVVPRGEDGFAPHTWRLARGGVRLTGHHWCRRYAVVPADAPLGTAAHELGHLLLGWPDLPAARLGQGLPDGAGRSSGRRGRSRAALRTPAGRARAEPASAVTRAADLEDSRVLVLPSGDIAAAHAGSILVFENPQRGGVPRLHRRVPLLAEDLNRPLLAVLRPYL